MDYQKHKEYFATAYRTGSDIWTHIPMKNRGALLMEKLPPNALVLDVGSGRGLLAKKMAESGFSVIGIDFEKEIVKKTNELVKGWGLEGKLKFVEGDALDIPFVDNSFDAVFDFGLLENLYQEDWEKYANEVGRVLKPGGYYLNTSLSKETQEFLGFRPKGSPSGELKKYDVVYHFFTKDEIKNIFDHKLNPIEQNIKFSDHPDQVAVVETLFQKKIEENEGEEDFDELSEENEEDEIGLDSQEETQEEEETDSRSSNLDLSEEEAMFNTEKEGYQSKEDDAEEESEDY